MKGICIVSILFLLSCQQETGVDFIIHNESSNVIDTVKITTTDFRSKINLLNINSGSKKASYLNMNDVIKIDGHYIIEFITSDRIKEKQVGYYTNGSPFEEIIDIYFFDDTIKYKQTLRDY